MGAGTPKRCAAWFSLQVAVLVVELHAPANALGLDEARAVGQPAAPDLLSGRRRRDQAGHGGVVARAFQGGDHGRQRQLALGRQAFQELADFRLQAAAGRERGGSFVGCLRARGGRADADGGGRCLAGGGHARRGGRAGAEGGGGTPASRADMTPSCSNRRQMNIIFLMETMYLTHPACRLHEMGSWHRKATEAGRHLGPVVGQRPDALSRRSPGAASLAPRHSAGPYRSVPGQSAPARARSTATTRSIPIP